MRVISLLSLATAAVCVLAKKRTYDTYNPSASQIAIDAQTAKTAHTTSNVGGKAFNRFVVIWLENTNFDKAAENSDMEWLASQGIVLDNYWALTHPSEPNYMAAVGGDYFALDDDRFISLPSNVSTIVDLLDTKGISWAEYQEHIPYTGYNGFEYKNQKTFANDYVRKHNPLVFYESVSKNEERMQNIKSFTTFQEDLESELLPQWSFITPNMTNDGHDTNINVASSWSRDFLTPLLSNEYFMKDTLILLTFDENENYRLKNRVYALLLGGAVPEDKKGTIDHTFYDHYSEISTVEVNWDLPNLGRNDVDANVFDVVASIAGVENKEVDTTYKVNNQTYTGYLNNDEINLPAPNVNAKGKNGKGVLDSISSVWADEYSSQVSESYFTSTTTTAAWSIGDATTTSISSSSASSSTSSSPVSHSDSVISFSSSSSSLTSGYFNSSSILSTETSSIYSAASQSSSPMSQVPSSSISSELASKSSTYHVSFTSELSTSSSLAHSSSTGLSSENTGSFSSSSVGPSFIPTSSETSGALISSSSSSSSSSSFSTVPSFSVSTPTGLDIITDIEVFDVRTHSSKAYLYDWFNIVVTLSSSGPIPSNSIVQFTVPNEFVGLKPLTLRTSSSHLDVASTNFDAETRIYTIEFNSWGSSKQNIRGSFEFTVRLSDSALSTMELGSKLFEFRTVSQVFTETLSFSKIDRSKPWKQGIFDGHNPIWQIEIPGELGPWSSLDISSILQPLDDYYYDLSSIIFEIGSRFDKFGNITTKRLSNSEDYSTSGSSSSLGISYTGFVSSNEVLRITVPGIEQHQITSFSNSIDVIINNGAATKRSVEDFSLEETLETESVSVTDVITSDEDPAGSLDSSVSTAPNEGATITSGSISVSDFVSSEVPNNTFSMFTTDTFIGVSTITAIASNAETTVVTITSCHDKLCTQTTIDAIATVVASTIDNEFTLYTTYCPLSTYTTKSNDQVVTVTSIVTEAPSSINLGK